MSLIVPVRGFTPSFGQDCWLAPNSTVIGEVEFGDHCTVWFGAVVRGDVNYIKVGAHSNIQDNVTIHGTFEKSGTTIGRNVSIGHNAVIHGCEIRDGALIGIGAIVLDDAIIGEGSIIAAGAVVLAGTHVPPNTIFAGTPAKKVKELDQKNKQMIEKIAGNYTKYASWFKNENKDL